MADKPLVNVRTDSESIISMVLGAMVVVVIGALLFSYVRDWRTKRNQTPVVETPTTSSPTPVVVEELPQEGPIDLRTNEQGESVPANLPAKYTVKPGDSSWKIAQAFYGSGFNYVDIEQANNLQAEQELTTGMELTIPQVPVRTSQSARVQPSTVTAREGQNSSSPVGPSKGDDSAAQEALKKE